MINEGSFFVFYAHNIPVKGTERSVIYNLKKGTLNFIPNSLYDIVLELKTKKVEELANTLSEEDQDTLKEYLAYLRENQVGFYTDDVDHFPDMPLDYHNAEHMTVCVLEFNRETVYQTFINQLDDLLCKDLEIRIWKTDLDLKQLDTFFCALSQTTVRSVCLNIENHNEIDYAALEGIYKAHPKIEEIYILSASVKQGNLNENIHFVHRTAEEVFNKPFPADKFIINRGFFLKAQKYHTYFYKRVEIAKNGDIKNCLLHTSSFGNISSHTLTEVLNNPEFTKWWNVSNDQIRELAGNELRYAMINHQPLIESDNGFFNLN